MADKKRTHGVSPATNVEVVTRLFAAAHWEIGDSDYITYEEALADLPYDGGALDRQALAAAREIIATMKPSEVRYSPALLRETVEGIRRRERLAQPALPADTAPAADRETNRAALLEAKAALARARGPLANALRETVRTPNAEDFDDAGEIRT
jgi:cellulose biosynthesis protein BcsQ